MKIRMIVDRTGPDDGRWWPPAGSELDVADALGAAVCEQRWAVPVATPDPVEFRAEPAAPQEPPPPPVVPADLEAQLTITAEADVTKGPTTDG